MDNAQRFQFTDRTDAFGIPDAVPQLPITLQHRTTQITTAALLDTGASVNVLPHSIGVQLGAKWEEQTTAVTLAGNLGAVEARGLLLSTQIGNFDPIRLVFAWAASDEVPLLLGRMNFFLEFDVCFYRSQLAFEIRRRLP